MLLVWEAENRGREAYRRSRQHVGLEARWRRCWGLLSRSFLCLEGEQSCGNGMLRLGQSSGRQGFLRSSDTRVDWRFKASQPSSG